MVEQLELFAAKPKKSEIPPGNLGKKKIFILFGIGGCGVILKRMDDEAQAATGFLNTGTNPEGRLVGPFHNSKSAKRYMKGVKARLKQCRHKYSATKPSSIYWEPEREPINKIAALVISKEPKNIRELRQLVNQKEENSDDRTRTAGLCNKM
jgi:hypothetical protein